MNAIMLHRYVELRRDYDRAKREVNEIKSEMDALEQVLLEDFASSGVQNITLDDGANLYVSTMTWARAKPGADLVAALRAAGHDELIVTTVNQQTLSAWAREVLQDGDLPPAVADAVIIDNVTSVRVKGK